MQELTKEYLANLMVNKNFSNVVRASLITTGSKIYCINKQYCLNINNELVEHGFKTRIGCNEAGTWSIYIIKAPTI